MKNIIPIFEFHEYEIIICRHFSNKYIFNNSKSFFYWKIELSMKVYVMTKILKRLILLK